jgi:8-oxo-dGTP diphosphatase
MKIMRRGFDYIGVGVGAVIVNEQNQVFLARRGPKSGNERGLWEFPGGAVEFGEKLRDALVREIFEEFGVRIEVGEMLDVSDHILPEESQHWVSPTFICHILAGAPAIREPEKCSEIGWFDIGSIPPELTKISRENLDHYLQKIK